MSHDPLTAYLSEVSGIPRLSPKAEEQELARARDGDAEARKQVLAPYLAEAAEIALRIRPEWLQPLDTIQEANVVLSRLIDDPSTRRIARMLDRRIAEHFNELAPPELT